jgi:hypothetical protein
LQGKIIRHDFQQTVRKSLPGYTGWAMVRLPCCIGGQHVETFRRLELDEDTTWPASSSSSGSSSSNSGGQLVIVPRDLPKVVILADTKHKHKEVLYMGVEKGFGKALSELAKQLVEGQPHYDGKPSYFVAEIIMNMILRWLAGHYMAGQWAKAKTKVK